VCSVDAVKQHNRGHAWASSIVRVRGAVVADLTRNALSTAEQRFSNCDGTAGKAARRQDHLEWSSRPMSCEVRMTTCLRTARTAVVRYETVWRARARTFTERKTKKTTLGPITNTKIDFWPSSRPTLDTDVQADRFPRKSITMIPAAIVVHTWCSDGVEDVSGRFALFPTRARRSYGWTGTFSKRNRLLRKFYPRVLLFSSRPHDAKIANK